MKNICIWIRMVLSQTYNVHHEAHQYRVQPAFYYNKHSWWCLAKFIMWITNHTNTTGSSLHFMITNILDRYDHIGTCSRLIQRTTPTSVLVNKFHIPGSMNDQWEAENWVKDWVWRGMCVSVKMWSYLSILSWFWQYYMNSPLSYLQKWLRKNIKCYK